MGWAILYLVTVFVSAVAVMFQIRASGQKVSGATIGSLIIGMCIPALNILMAGLATGALMYEMVGKSHHSEAPASDGEGG